MNDGKNANPSGPLFPMLAENERLAEHLVKATGEILSYFVGPEVRTVDRGVQASPGFDSPLARTQKTMELLTHSLDNLQRLKSQLVAEGSR